MSGDYLWDRSGPREPDLLRLERVLAPLGQADPAPPFRAPARRHTRWSAPFLMAAAIAAVAIVGTLAAVVRGARPESGSLAVTTLAGTPTIDARAIRDRGTLSPGRWIQTDGLARAVIDIGGLGQVDVDPRSDLGLVSTRPGDYRLHLRRGTIHARIWAPPGQFSVETPSATTVDLGCAYTLSVGDDGAGLVRVTVGWVGFAWHGREAFIPAGAVCLTRPALGPGTPYFEDVSDGFRSAIDVLDAGRPDGPDAAAERQAALARVLGEARERDTVTLWHLLSRVHPEERDRVFDTLARLVPPPATVSRAGIRNGDRTMLDAWWDRLGLGTTTWWRTWTEQWRDR